MATYLDRIGAWHRDVAASDRRDLKDLAARARAVPPPRDFTGALKAHRAKSAGEATIALVAEIKRRSPSKGDIAPDLDPAEVARAYDVGRCVVPVGADRRPALRRQPRGPEVGPAPRSGLPSCARTSPSRPADVYDARIMGADAVLLIVALLDDGELAELHGIAGDLGMAALVEVHDEDELERALGIGASARRGEPTRPAHLRGGQGAGRRASHATSLPAW